MTKDVQFTLTLTTEEAGVYKHTSPVPLPVPRAGEDVYLSNNVHGQVHGWWTVVSVKWFVPNEGAMTPTMEAYVIVRWARDNAPEPVYDEEAGWVR